MADYDEQVGCCVVKGNGNRISLNNTEAATFEDLTPAERDQLKQFRDRGFRSLKKLALLQIFISVVSIIVGIVTFVYAAENPAFPYIVGGPVWSAIMVMIGAVCGYLAAKNGYNRDDVPANVKFHVIVHYTFNVLCITICLGSVALSVLGIVFCVSTGPKIPPSCQPNAPALKAVSVASVVVGILLAILCIMGTCYFCGYARTLGFKSRQQHRMEARLQAMQRQLDDMRRINSAQGQYPAQGQGYAQGQGQGHVNAGYCKWESG